MEIHNLILVHMFICVKIFSGSAVAVPAPTVVPLSTAITLMAHRLPWIGYSILKCAVTSMNSTVFALHRNVLVLF